MILKHSFFINFLLVFSVFAKAQNPDDVYQKFVQAYDELNAAAIGNLYSEDAELMYLYQNSKPESYKGNAAVFQSFKDFFAYTKKENCTLKIQFKIIDRKKVANKILDNGFYHLAVSIPNKEGYNSYGKISTVLKMEAGEWKFCTDASTSATKEEFEKVIAIQTNNESSMTNLNDVDQIRLINQAYLNNWIKNDEKGVLGLFTKDARIAPNSMTPIDSLHNMKQFWFPNDGSKTIIHQFDADEISLNIEDDIAYATQKTILDFAYEKEDFRMGRIQKGIDTTIYKKQKNGTWKMWRKAWIDYEIIKK